MSLESPRLVIVVGAECSGKTTLCDALGQALDAIVVPEFLRVWCARQGRTPTRQEQRIILAGQLRAQRAAFKAARLRACPWVICDGAPMLTAAYSLQYFDDASVLKAGLTHARRAHIVLLTDPAIPWVPDGHLRDGPQVRAAVHQLLLGLLGNAQIPHHLISGNPRERLRASLSLLR